MIKLLTLLITIGLTTLFYIIIAPNLLVYKILTIIISFIVSLLLQILLFFLVLFILTIFCNKASEYNKFYRFVLYAYSKVILSFFSVKIKVNGIEKIKDEPFTLYFNHRSNLDSLIIDTVLKNKKLIFIGKKSLFKIPFVGKIITKIGYISLNRGHIKEEVLSINKAIDKLNNGINVGIAPEGTRNFTDDYLLDFKAGSFHIPLKSKSDIVICTLKNVEQIRTNLFFKKHYVILNIVDVLKYDSFKDYKTQTICEIVRNKMIDDLK